MVSYGYEAELRVMSSFGRASGDDMLRPEDNLKITAPGFIIQKNRNRYSASGDLHITSVHRYMTVDCHSLDFT